MTETNLNTALYDILQVSPDASANDIKLAYKRLAMELHPDKHPHGEIQAKENFVALKQAYDILSNPIKRKRYDETGSTDFKELNQQLDSFVNQIIIPAILQHQETSFEIEDMLRVVIDVVYNLIQAFREQLKTVNTEKSKLERFLKRLKHSSGDNDNGKAHSLFQPRLLHCQQQINQINDQMELAKTVRMMFTEYSYSVDVETGYISFQTTGV